MSTWRDFLNRLSQEYHDAEENAFEPIEDGTYLAQVEGANLETSKKGDPMVKLQFVITEGEYQGRREWKYHLLKAGKMRYLKWDLSTLGLQLEEIAELPSRLREVIDQTVTLEIKTKSGQDDKSYRNIYLKMSPQGGSIDRSETDLPY